MAARDTLVILEAIRLRTFLSERVLRCVGGPAVYRWLIRRRRLRRSPRRVCRRRLLRPFTTYTQQSLRDRPRRKGVADGCRY